jgi:hypothetical protein
MVSFALCMPVALVGALITRPGSSLRWNRGAAAPPFKAAELAESEEHLNRAGHADACPIAPQPNATPGQGDVRPIAVHLSPAPWFTAAIAYASIFRSSSCSRTVTARVNGKAIAK